MLRRIQCGILALALVSAYACGGDSNSTMSTPTSPTNPSGSGGGAVVSGIVASGSASTQSVGVSGGRVMDVAGVTRVEVINTNISSPVDREGRFMLVGVPAGSVVLKFSGTGVNATVNVSGLAPNQTINIIVTVSGSNATVVSDSRNPEAGQMPVNGIISGLTGSAASFQFVVNGLTIHGDAQTQFFGDDDKRGSFADLKNGVRVEVKAIARDGGLYAFRLHVNKGDANESDKGEFEIEGAIGGLRGLCPLLTFTVKGVLIATNGSTKFSGGACVLLKNGDEAEVKGIKQADGSVLATSVKRD